MIKLINQNSTKMKAVQECFEDESVMFEKTTYTPKNYKINNLTALLNAFNKVCSSKSPRVITIEEGIFKDSYSQFYLGNVCCIKDGDNVYFGFSPFYQISKNMYDYCARGNKLSEIVKQIKNDRPFEFENFNDCGVIGFITNNQNYSRRKGIISAIESAKKSKPIEISSVEKTIKSAFSRPILKIKASNYHTFYNFKSVDKKCAYLLQCEEKA